MRKQTQSLHNLLRRPEQVSLSLGQEDHSQRSRAPQHSRVSFSPRQRRPKRVSLSLGQEDHSQRSRAPQESRGYQPRVSFSPKAESPTEDTAQRGQATGQGEPLPSPRTPSGPTTAAAAAENLTSGDQGGKSGGPLPDESQATGAGAAPKEAAASKTEQVDDSEDEYTSESTEEVPALQGTPLTTGARMWFPSQFPLTLQLVKHLQSGEFLPEPIQLSRLGFGRTRAVFSLPASALPNTPEEGVLKLCMVRQHHGKESEWGAHCSLVAPTYLKGQISVDFSVQRKATLASNWVAQFGGNVSLTHDLALYALSTLLALELRGAVLCDVGPSNLMVRAPIPYPQMTYGDVAGWSVHHKIRRRGVGNFESVFRSFPAIQTELAQVLSEAKQQGLKAAFKTAANRCGRFGALLVNEGLAVLEAGSQNLEAANLPPFPLDLAWAELPE